MSICVVDGGPCQCQPSEGFPCPGVTRLRAQVAALEVDAGRWRHWRKHHHYTALPVFGYSFAQIEHWSNQQNESKLDAAIDAALAARKGEA